MEYITECLLPGAQGKDRKGFQMYLSRERRERAREKHRMFRAFRLGWAIGVAMGALTMGLLMDLLR